MKLEEQNTSLELSKELKEAGYKQEGIWWWKSDEGESYLVYFNSRYRFSKGKILAVAPTVAELGEALRNFEKSDWRHKIIYEGTMTIYKNYDTRGIRKEIEADTEANARAKMWLYLKRKGLLKNQ